LALFRARYSGLLDTMRIQKYLSQCGVASRRTGESLIAKGRVTVNGVIASLGDKIDPRKDTVEVNGEPVTQGRLVYVVLNKPKGVVTTAKDTHSRKTVLDFVEGVSERVYPVGRLDMDVSGTLLLTNDGELAHRLMHPRHQVDKTYLVWVQGAVSSDAAAALEKGVELEDGVTAPASAEILKRSDDATLIRLTIHEGRKRLVKRMCAAVGHPVRDLRRVSIGALRANGLRPGEWRYLHESEIDELKRISGLGPGIS